MGNLCGKSSSSSAKRRGDSYHRASTNNTTPETNLPTSPMLPSTNPLPTSSTSPEQRANPTSMFDRQRNRTSSVASSASSLNRGASARRQPFESSVASAATSAKNHPDDDDSDDDSAQNTTINQPQQKNNVTSIFRNSKTSNGYITPREQADKLPKPTSSDDVTKNKDNLKNFVAYTSALDFYARKTAAPLYSSSRQGDSIFPIEITPSLCKRWLKSFVASLPTDLSNHPVCKMLFGEVARYHLGYAAFDSNLYLIIAVENCTTFAAASSARVKAEREKVNSSNLLSGDFNSGIGAPPAHASCPIEQIASCPRGTIVHIVKTITENVGKPPEHAEKLLDKFKDHEDEVLLQSLYSKYGPLAVPPEQERVRFFRLADFMQYVFDHEMSFDESIANEKLLSGIEEGLKRLGSIIHNTAPLVSSPSWSMKCVACGRNSSVDLPIMKKKSSWTLAKTAIFFPGVECTSFDRHFCCFMCLANLVRKVNQEEDEIRKSVIAQVDLRQRESYLRCPKCGDSSKTPKVQSLGTFQQEDFSSEISPEMIKKWTGCVVVPSRRNTKNTQHDDEFIQDSIDDNIKKKRSELQISIPLVGNAKKRRQEILKQINQERDRDLVYHHVSEIRKLLTPQCPLCFLDLRCFSGRSTIMCPRCDHECCGLCFSGAPCSNPDHVSYDLDGANNFGDDDDNNERRVKYFPTEQIFHEWGKNFLEKVLVYLEVEFVSSAEEEQFIKNQQEQEQHRIESNSINSSNITIESFIFDKTTLLVLDQVLRELRFPLSAVGLWPLPAPWRIRVVEDELKRREISQLQLITAHRTTSSSPEASKNNNFFSPPTTTSAATIKSSDSAFWRELEGDDEDKTSSRSLDKYFDEIDAKKKSLQNPHAKELASLTMEFSL